MRTILLPSLLFFLLSSCSTGTSVRRTADVPRIEVIYCRLAPSDEFVEVRFRMHGVETFHPEPADTYLVDEGTGEKYYIMQLQRVGRLADIRNPEDSARSVLFRNLERKIRPGTRVTLVAGGLRQEHVVVGK